MPTSPAIRDYGSRQLLRFLLLTGGMYLLWFFGYEQWLALDGRLDLALCANIAQTSARLLQTAGFDAVVAPNNAYLLLMSGHPSVIVGIPCNGLVLYALFGGFVLAFPGPWRRKLWFIPAGMVLIWVLNILRVAALAINHSYAYQSVYFNHHYTYTFVVYGCIFGLWMLWAKRLAVYDRQHSAPSTTFAGA
ncbi:exosortase X [Hymenobacter negativus]|nr:MULTISPECIES: archaeosortase/exosortase family protein [Bacteria]MBR7209711.1 archaeosortase/exosortase family protein [Microvirga sp. STS02]